MLDFTLTPEQLAIQKHARDFAMKEVLPVAWYYDETHEIPLWLFQKAFDAGLIGGDIPKEYGGKGYGITEGVIVTEEIAAACAGIATSIFDNSLGFEPIMLCDNEEAKRKYLPQFAREFKRICFATSEPTMGSDVAGIRCHAEKQGDDYILNGTKYWITNGSIADYMTVFATVDPKLQHAGICAFVVERDWPGVTVGEPIPKLGQRGSNTVGLNFKNVRVPRENVLAEPGAGFVLAMRTFTRTRPVIGAFAVGTARAALEYAIDYVKKRTAFGHRLSSYEAIQFRIADMYQKVETSRLLTLKAAWEVDRETGDPTIAASLSKVYATEASFEVVSSALQVFGGYGYTKMYPIEKLLRDSRLFTIYEGTSEVQRIIIAGYALNMYQPTMPPLEDLALFRDRLPFDPQKPGAEPVRAWRCRICGYVHYGDEAPDECPSCFFPKTAFKEVIYTGI